MILLDTYQGSEVDVYLNKFAELAQDQTVTMNYRDVDPDQDWLAQATDKVSKEAYLKAQSNPLTKPPRISNIFGETQQGIYFKDTLGSLLEYQRIYTNAYTPYGFMGWHTDCDVAGWYIMFSLNQGPGTEFYWIEDEQVQVLEEPRGWTIKAGEIPKQAPYLWHATLARQPKWTAIMFWDDQQAWQRACDLVTTKSSLDPVPELVLYGIFE